MDKKPTKNLDGFIVKRRRVNPLDPSAPKLDHAKKKMPDYMLDRSKLASGQDLSDQFVDPEVEKATIDMNLENPPVEGKKKKLENQSGGKRKLPIGKIIKFGLLGLLIILLIGAGYFAYKLLVASSNVFKGGGSTLDVSQLRKEGDSRINVLMAATSEDDKGHDGADLTDSIMIASIDPVNKTAALISIPRDLYIKMPGCTLYFQEKINAAYQCGNHIKFKQDGFPDGGMGYLQKIVEEVFDLNINYYAKINYRGFKQSVDAVGGVDVNIRYYLEDHNFDWQYGPNALVLQPGKQHLNGTQALLLARSRFTSPRGDFDRTQNQRELLVALLKKAGSLDTLSNPIKVSGLIDAVGNNLVTNFSRDDILKMAEIARDMHSDDITSVGLADEPDGPLTTGNIAGISVVRPKAGDFAYDPLRTYVRMRIPDGYLVKESPTIAIFNGSGKDGAAAILRSTLISYGYGVISAGTAPTSDYTDTVLIDQTSGKKEISKRYLQNRFGVDTIGSLPEGISSKADFVVIIGTKTKL